MCSNPCFRCIPMQTLSDEAAVEILNFLQQFTWDFEIRYATQVRRYYDERSQHNIVSSSNQTDGDDPFF